MRFARIDDTTLHYDLTAGDGVPVVFLNSLGTDLRIWDDVLPELAPDTPILRMDKHGHGLSGEGSNGNGTANMDRLISDAAGLMDHLGLAGALVCGVSVGGMIAQGLAAARPDLVRGLVLCCTGARIGDAESWAARIDTVQAGGLSPMADGILSRWFSPCFHSERPADLDGYRAMLTRTPASGYAAVCAVIRDTDLSTRSAALRLPVHCIAGEDDLATPPDLVQLLADLIPDATIETIPRCAHLPCIEAPCVVAAAVNAMRVRLS